VAIPWKNSVVPKLLTLAKVQIIFFTSSFHGSNTLTDAIPWTSNKKETLGQFSLSADPDSESCETIPFLSSGGAGEETEAEKVVSEAEKRTV
jgi:hypothetical protein